MKDETFVCYGKFRDKEPSKTDYNIPEYAKRKGVRNEFLEITKNGGMETLGAMECEQLKLIENIAKIRKYVDFDTCTGFKGSDIGEIDKNIGIAYLKAFNEYSAHNRKGGIKKAQIDRFIKQSLYNVKDANKLPEIVSEKIGKYLIMKTHAEKVNNQYGMEVFDEETLLENIVLINNVREMENLEEMESGKRKLSKPMVDILKTIEESKKAAETCPFYRRQGSKKVAVLVHPLYKVLEGYENGNISTLVDGTDINEYAKNLTAFLEDFNGDVLALEEERHFKETAGFYSKMIGDGDIIKTKPDNPEPEKGWGAIIDLIEAIKPEEIYMAGGYKNKSELSGAKTDACFNTTLNKFKEQNWHFHIEVMEDCTF